MSQAEVLQKTISIAEKADSLKAITFLESQGKPTEVAENYSQLVRQLYSKNKDVPAMTVFARAGMQFCLSHAELLESKDEKTALALKGTAKTIAYNLGANTWPGWNDSGITITKTDLALGLDAAKINLRLAEELKRDDKVFGNAYWLEGAHYLAAGKQKPAIEAFRRSADRFRVSKQEDFALMAEGYLALVELKQHSTQTEGHKRYESTIKELKQIGSEDARFGSSGFCVLRFEKSWTCLSHLKLHQIASEKGGEACPRVCCTMRSAFKATDIAELITKGAV